MSYNRYPNPLGGGSVAPSGSTGAPVVITAVGGITAPTNQRTLEFVASNGGAVTVTANPQIGAGTVVGQELYLAGTSASNTLTISNGTGLRLNGPCILGLDSVIYLMWFGSYWCEVARNGN